MEVRALVIDPIDFSRRLLTRALSESGLAVFTFIEAKNYLDAVSLFNSETTDIIFVNFESRDVSSLGFRLVGKIRSKQKRHVPIIVVTTDRAASRIDKALDTAGIDYYIVKPFTVDSLRVKLEPVFKKFEKARKAGLTTTWSKF